MAYPSFLTDSYDIIISHAGIVKAHFGLEIPEYQRYNTCVGDIPKFALYPPQRNGSRRN
jgi:hypothetical protein